MHKENPLKYFSVMFVPVFLILFFSLSPLKSIQYSLNSSLSKSLVEKHINRKVGSGKQSRFEYSEDGDKLILYTIYYEKKNPDGTIIQKAITINLFNESYIPLIFLLSLFFATAFSLKDFVIRTSIGLFVLEIYLMLKVAALFFDNYSYPEFELHNIDNFLSGVVFYYNKLIKSVGNGINFILVAFIWLTVSGTLMKLIPDLDDNLPKQKLKK